MARFESGGDGVVDGVGDVFGAGGDDDVGGSAEGKGLVGGGIDGGRGGRERARDMDGGEMQRVGAEGVGEMDTEGHTADGDADDLTEGRVAQIVGGKGILRFGNLLRSRPGADPDLRCSWKPVRRPAQEPGRQREAGRRWRGFLLGSLGMN